MVSYNFVYPIQTSVYLTFDDSFSNYLVVNFFNLGNHRGLIIDENNNRQVIDLSQLGIDQSKLCACFDIGKHCVGSIQQFYPGKKVKFITARTVSNDGSIEVEPDYFLFFGLN